MKNQKGLKVLIGILMAVFLVAGFSLPAKADTAAQIDRDAHNALKKLYAKTPAAKDLAKIAKGILVFPSIIKGGFIVAGQYGEGALIIDGKTVGYYNTVAGSFGLQAGAQSFGYALFFIDQAALDYLRKSDGWEIGVGPTVTVVDQGFARNLSSTTAKDDIYAFFFSQKGLMAGMGIQGTKITKITPK